MVGSIPVATVQVITHDNDQAENSYSSGCDFEIIKSDPSYISLCDLGSVLKTLSKKCKGIIQIKCWYYHNPTLRNFKHNDLLI